MTRNRHMRWFSGRKNQRAQGDAVHEELQTRRVRSSRTQRVTVVSTVSDSTITPRTVSSTQPGEFADPRTLTAHSVIEQERIQQTQGILARPKVVQFPERERERKRARLSACVLRVTASVLSVLIVCVLVWALCFSSLFALHSDNIEITGTNNWVSQTTVQELVAAQSGKSLILINTVNIEKNIRSLPGVTHAQVTKQYPHGIAVAITAQVPAAILKSGETLVAVDSEGRKLNDVHASVQGIPVIQVSNIDKALKQSAVSQAITVLAALDEPLRKRISSVEAQTRDSIVTTIDNNAISIIWGDASKLKLKRAIVETLLSQPNTMNGATVINVSAPDRPTIK